MSIFSLIRKDHQELKVHIRVLKKGDMTLPELRHHLVPFIQALETHAKAEEKSLYESSREIPGMKRAILGGEIEQSVADSLVFEIHDYDLGDLTNFDELAAKAKVLAEIVEHHLKKEEEELLPQLRGYFTAQESHELGVAYLECKTALEPRVFDVFARSTASPPGF